MAHCATDYTLRELGQAKSDCPDWLFQLNFFDFLHEYPIDKLDELFPKLKDGGGLDPPPQYLSSGYKLVDWRQLSEQEAAMGSCQWGTRHQCRGDPTAHVYELLDYVKFHTLWKKQAGKEVNKYFPRSTYEDIVWTSMSIVILARTQFQNHAIVQRRHGTDDCEKMFCIARNKCANATAFGTTHQNICGGESWRNS